MLITKKMKVSTTAWDRVSWSSHLVHQHYFVRTLTTCFRKCFFRRTACHPLRDKTAANWNKGQQNIGFWTSKSFFFSLGISSKGPKNPKLSMICISSTCDYHWKGYIFCILSINAIILSRRLKYFGKSFANANLQLPHQPFSTIFSLLFSSTLFDG